jgi:hypothetical protein
MHPANRYVIRKATDDDGALRRLAELDGQCPLAGPTLIAEIDRGPVAAVSLADERVIADRFQPIGIVRQLLCMRRAAAGAYSAHALAPEPPGAALGTVRAAPATAHSTA